MSLIDNSNKPLITVDFDGTLCDFDFPNIGAPKKGAKEALEKFRSLGYLLLIYSCRTCHWHYDIFGGAGIPVMERPTVVAMKEWLDKHEIPYDEIDDGSKGKPLADFYCDDKAVRVDDNWDEVVGFIEGRTKREKS